jgi:hypothetical protein
MIFKDFLNKFSQKYGIARRSVSRKVKLKSAQDIRRTTPFVGRCFDFSMIGIWYAAIQIFLLVTYFHAQSIFLDPYCLEASTEIFATPNF